jgi:4-diphosphocytidyl-2-C-methyl-D-erythritol kinase
LSLSIRVPAKINLWLEVIRKRKDGYHDLSSLMLPVKIYDFLELEFRETMGITLECDDPEVPPDASNLAWRAAEMFLHAVGSKMGLHLRIAKNIPVAAGLGGGSADAAGVLLALNTMHKNCLAMPELESLGQDLGADVPFFLHQRPALATGIGEELYPVTGIPDYPLVLIKPPLRVSTGWVYEHLKLTRRETRIKLQGFVDRPWQLLDVLQNDLESVTMSEYPVLSRMKEWLILNGAIGALMSGSGPTMFGVFRERNQAERTSVLAKRTWEECWVEVAQVRGNSAIPENMYF